MVEWSSHVLLIELLRVRIPGDHEFEPLLVKYDTRKSHHHNYYDRSSTGAQLAQWSNGVTADRRLRVRFPGIDAMIE